MANREHFNNKWGIKIDKEELDRKWRMHLREQEEADKAQLTLGGSALLVGGGAGGGYIPETPTGPSYYVQLQFDEAEGFPVTNPGSLSEWNTFFNLPSEGAPFTSIVYESPNLVTLSGNGEPDMNISEDLFISSTQILSFKDDGKVISVGDSAFFGSTIVEFVSGTIDIASSAFKGSALSSLQIPQCRIAGEGAFTDCANLSNPQIDSIEELGIFAFLGCSLLAEFTSNTLTYAGFGCFKGCYSLQSVSLPSVTSIGNQAFGDCYSLISLSMPSLEFLGTTTGNDSVFSGVNDPSRGNAGLDVYVPSALSTVNAGNPDGDITFLLSLFSSGTFEPVVYYV